MASISQIAKQQGISTNQYIANNKSTLPSYAGAGTIVKNTATPSVNQNPQANTATARFEQGLANLGYQNNNGQAFTTNPRTVPTTISNSNAITKANNLSNTLANLSNKGSTQSVDGTITYPDGTISANNNASMISGQNSNIQAQTGYQQPIDGSFTPQDWQSSPEYQLLEQMRSSLDANTSSSIAAIQAQLQQRRNETNATSANQAQTLQNSLLMGGATGQGSSAQYAPISSQGVMTAQENYRMKQIMELDNQEQQLIQAAKAAQQSGQFDILGKQIQVIQNLRDKKAEQTAALNKTIADQNNKLRDQNLKSSQDSGIAQLYQSGTTSVPAIVQAMKANGNPVTAEQVADTLKNIVPAGLDDLVKTMRNNGAPADKIQQVLKSPDLSSAYTTAGAWTASGTGDIAKYNLYKAQAIDAKVTPLGYQDWLDYNAKVKTDNALRLKRSPTYKQASLGLNTGSGTGSVSKGSPQYKKAMDVILGSAKFTKDQKASLINSIDNGEDPFTVIKNQAKNIMGQTEATKLTNYEVSRDTLSDIGKQLDEFYKKGGDTGIIKGNFESVINKLGKVNNPALVDLATQISGNLAIYRNAISGTAYSKQEGQEIQKIFPGINNSQALNSAILHARKTLFDSVIDSSYRTALGKTYDDLKKSESDAIANTPPTPLEAQKIAQDSLQSFYDANDKNKLLLDNLHSAYPNASVLEVYQKLKERKLIQ